MQGRGLRFRHVARVESEYTAQAHVTTDLDANQLAAFHPGAMNHSHVNRASADGSTTGHIAMSMGARSTLRTRARKLIALPAQNLRTVSTGNSTIAYRKVTPEMRRKSSLVALALYLVCGIVAGQTPPATPKGTAPPQVQPVQPPPEPTPPEQVPPEEAPPGEVPPGQEAPGQVAPGQIPPGQLPPGTTPNAMPAPLQTIETEESPAWTRTLERIASGVVSIQVDEVRAFDTEWNTSAQATGFVVDAKRGLILTNRHRSEEHTSELQSLRHLVCR